MHLLQPGGHGRLPKQVTFVLKKKNILMIDKTIWNTLVKTVEIDIKVILLMM